MHAPILDRIQRGDQPTEILGAQEAFMRNLDPTVKAMRRILLNPAAADGQREHLPQDLAPTVARTGAVSGVVASERRGGGAQSWLAPMMAASYRPGHDRTLLHPTNPLQISLEFLGASTNGATQLRKSRSIRNHEILARLNRPRFFLGGRF
jgi:hypothetical protein